LTGLESAASCLPSLPQGARILIIRLRSIGDIVLLTPALRLLKEWRPDLRVSVLVEPRFQELLADNPDVEEVLTAGSGTGWAKVVSRLRAIQKIRRRQYTLCVNLHGGPTSRLLTRWSGARWTAGFDYFRSRRIYSFRVPHARLVLGQDSVHTAEHQAAVFFFLGLPRRAIPPARLIVTEEHAAWWREERLKLGVSPVRDYAVLHPTALFSTKQWAPENFARLGAYLEREARLEVVYSCGPGETSVLDAVERAAGRPLRRLEGTGLRQYAAALAGARLFVGNDSGPAHMAAALGRPGVVIFGSSSSQIWGPWPRQSSWQIVQNYYECNPCPGDRCLRFARPECILSVTFEQVRDAVEAVLARTVPSSA
jgi:predicted lipopolysaccharide heptosyltransferase III